MAGSFGTSASGADTPARVGIYYFGGWSGPLSHSLFAGLPRGGFAGRLPLYGWRDGTTHTMRSQLYWASRMGVEFLNFLWYYRPELAEAPFLNRGLANYVALKDHHGVGFATRIRTSRPSWSHGRNGGP